MISLLCLFVALVVSHFGFEGRTLGLIASVPGHCDYLLLEYALFFRKRSIPALDVGYLTVSLLHFDLFVMSICSFGCFPFWFRGQDLSSDCVSSWSLRLPFT